MCFTKEAQNVLDSEERLGLFAEKYSICYHSLNTLSWVLYDILANIIKHIAVNKSIEIIVKKKWSKKTEER